MDVSLESKSLPSVGYSRKSYLQTTSQRLARGKLVDLHGRRSLALPSVGPVISIYCDNSTAVFMAKNNKSGSRSKHIDIKYLAIRERVKEKKVVIEHISTELMIADPLTKGMPPLKFKDHVMNMGLSSLM
ncbi:hypothetical protein CK203_028442 [Vitis vinifera]|uniref:Copia protein n=1 Tax=Vitis vinifera TaxID=29760 RepID=A0A438J094_VITVI|nr:hypothetical protein CK203_028442 [Vitis vinifera]